MNSLKGTERAQAAPNVFEKIQRKIDQRSNRTSSKGWMSVAAVLVLLISSNIILIKNYYSQPTSTQTDQTYDNLVSDYNIYEL
ncbi:hypothetical protein N6H18_12870 [Reichenbachiella agarivorans]|uniref:Uncharacterized protein n=1 Tax=Reichenbachiella agarivorans TaxID=2979464 RepID=A0ABY6CL46_9BACT|nr:hypothetical protein [Reichenbachiella agarivorans]UXP31241.1 hypothetical protein N6H18_12870 [Reichenbachiella agarivorans]